jgi:hypothetical protein
MNTMATQYVKRHDMTHTWLAMHKSAKLVVRLRMQRFRIVESRE